MPYVFRVPLMIKMQSEFKMIELVAIEQYMDISNIVEETARANVELTFEYYKKVGFVKPWISYLIQFQDNYVGICAFKGQPIDNKVEIAYYTFPFYEGKGIATEACKKLIKITKHEDMNITVIARTLPEKNASTTVLLKNGFTLIGTVLDPEDGEVFEWSLNEKTAF